MRTAAPTIEQIRSEVARKRGEAVASTVDLNGKVNFSTLREKFIMPTWGRLIGVGMSDRAAGGAYIMAAYHGEAAVEECVGMLREMGFRIRPSKHTRHAYFVS